MKQGMQWLTIQIDRRRFLRTTAATAFGLLAGLSVGRTSVLATPPCTGPYGSGQCDAVYCGSGSNSWQCNYSSYCQYWTNAWYPGACWHDPAGTNCTCCDCYCCPPWGCFYCYCYGGC